MLGEDEAEVMVAGRVVEHADRADSGIVPTIESSSHLPVAERVLSRRKPRLLEVVAI